MKILINYKIKLSNILLLSILILSSCQSTEKKLDDAFDMVKKEKIDSGSSTIVIKNVVEEPKQSVQIIKNTNEDEWKLFKLEMEKKIKLNETLIIGLKKATDSNSKTQRKIISLEKENDNLRRQMDDYHEAIKVEWENFKTKLDHQANQIAIELKDIKSKEN